MACELIGWCSLDTSAQAAWVQAVGSLIAIAVAIGVPLGLHIQERRSRAKQERISAVIVAGAISPFVANALSRIGFFRRQLTAVPDQLALQKQLPENAFATPEALLRFQDRFHLLGRTGVLANEHLADLALLQTAMRVIHEERLTNVAVEKMIIHCDRAQRTAETLLAELDAICPPRRDGFPKPEG